MAYDPDWVNPANDRKTHCRLSAVCPDWMKTPNTKLLTQC